MVVVLLVALYLIAFQINIKSNIQTTTNRVCSISRGYNSFGLESIPAWPCCWLAKGEQVGK